jgi:hypothetical protein
LPKLISKNGVVNPEEAELRTSNNDTSRALRLNFSQMQNTRRNRGENHQSSAVKNPALPFRHCLRAFCRILSKNKKAFPNEKPQKTDPSFSPPRVI